MPEPVVEIPNRPAFRASEVCEIAQIPAYVLKSWEKEFPGLGVPSKPGGPRVYRRGDVEQVLKIKQLLFNEGLTLAGVRRKLEGEPKPEEEPLLPELAPVAGDVRDKVARVKQELRSLLDLLSSPPPAGEKSENTTGAPAQPQTPVGPLPPPEAVRSEASRPSVTAQQAVVEQRTEAAQPGEATLPLLEPGDEHAPVKAPRRPRRGTRA